MKKQLKQSPLVAGNWKMNGDVGSAEALLTELNAGLSDNAPKCEIVVCPPFTLLQHVEKLLNKNKWINLGSQDCSEYEVGAYTGDVSPRMLSDIGCRYVVLGHSERRTRLRETNAMVKRKAVQAIHQGLIPIVCVGESLKERQEGRAQRTVQAQINRSLPVGLEPSQVVVAYEPIWAIGTGKTPTTTQISQMHLAIRQSLQTKCTQNYGSIRLLYGGSVNPDNVREIIRIPNVDGCLVGGASLKGEAFCDICLAY
ncbi:MAG: triose-phosphate isomerase [Rhodospirillaceae bacterium]|nr:triose-phosphate isomerase [Rhodospirillaceae bacterium]